MFPSWENETLIHDWELVIKIKYGDTLKRFGAFVHGRSMDHSMSSLKAKIINLFNFSLNTDLILTYTDEDGDSVALDEDEELCDAAITQRLNPLRIDVKLKTCGSSDTKPQTASSIHTWPQPISTRPHQLISAIGESLTSVTEPFQVVRSKLSQDFALKAASPAPALAEFDEILSKSELSNASLHSHGHVGGLSDAYSGPKINATPALETVQLAATNSSNPDSAYTPKQKGKISMTQDLGSSSIDSRNQHASEFIKGLLSCTLTTDELEKEGGVPLSGKSTTTLSAAPALVAHNSQNCEVILRKFSTVGASKVPGGIVPNPSERWYEKPKWRASHSHHGTFHRGVQCDGCGMYPITGPRFKSNVNEDYDLCSICFSETGNGADYTRIERAPYHSPSLFEEPCFPVSGYRIPSSRPFHGFKMGTSRVKPESSPRAKLRSLFVADITIPDGTMIPPRTPFTKIWRMRNNGTVTWPFGTHLLWTGGNRLETQSTAVIAAICGCPVGEEFDFTIDFMSPSEPGSYISYWRLATSSGQTFGQRVWAQIEVENPPTNYAMGFIRQVINLNLPPDSTGHNGMGIIDINAEPLDEALVNTVPSTIVEPMSDSLPQSKGSIDENSVEQTLLKELEHMGFKEIELNKEVLRQNDYDIEQSIDDLCGFAEWDPLLSELQEMGFNDWELNKKLLVKNGGSIKRVVLDLISGEKDE